MASTAMAMYVTDENGDVFYPIGHTGAIYDANGELLSNVLDGTVNGVSSLPRKLLPPNARIVYCDGDNDELKIQAAIDELAEAGGGVVYPVGECVLTLDNAVPATDNNAVMLPRNTYALNTASNSTRPNSASVRLYNNITIDGRFCNGVTLLVATVSAPNRITFFAAPFGGTLCGLNITMVCETEDLKTKCPFTLVGENVVLEHCTFKNIIGSNSSVSAGMAYGSLVLLNSTIQDVVIDSPITRGSNTNSRFILLIDCRIQNMEYTNSTPIDAKTYSKGYIYISGDIDGVVLKDSELYTLTLNGTVGVRNVILQNLSTNQDITMTNIDHAYLQDITVDRRLLLTDVSNITGDNITTRSDIYCFNRIDNIQLTNLLMNDFSYPAICYVDAQNMTNCRIFVRPEQANIDSVPLFNIGDCADVIIKNNVTNLPTLTTGTAKRSIISDNLTASAMIAGTVTLTSNSESGFIEGATLTVMATDGDVQGANMSDIGQVVYLWQKSADGTTWETVQDGQNTYTLKGDEGYIRCGVYDKYGFYAGAVYSDAYAVTGTTEEE